VMVLSQRSSVDGLAQYYHGDFVGFTGPEFGSRFELGRITGFCLNLDLATTIECHVCSHLLLLFFHYV
jgi:hypothetical protein